MGTMLRRALAAVLFALVALPAQAEVWMVTSSGVLGCRDRDILIALEAAETGPATPPEGCVELYSGERLLDQADVGGGFNAYMKVQRGDGSIVFVPSAAVAPDAGIGSATEDRGE